MTPIAGYMFSDEVEEKETDSCTIARREVTFKANDSLNIPYDGKEHVNHTASISSGSLVDGHTAILEFDSNSKCRNSC